MSPLAVRPFARHSASSARCSISPLRIVAFAVSMIVIPHVALSQGRTMGFSRVFNFPSAAGSNAHWISLPWNYEPADAGTIGVLDAEDLCEDLGGDVTVAAVLRWDEATSTVVEHGCGNPSPFALVTGVAYGIRNTVGQDIAGVVVGAHDNSFQYTIPATAGSQLSWLSIPYHVRAPENLGNLRVTAANLCLQVGQPELLAVVRWNSDLSVYESYGCGSEFQEPFEIERGQGYGLVNRGTQTIAWQPIHY